MSKPKFDPDKALSYRYKLGRMFYYDPELLIAYMRLRAKNKEELNTTQNNHTAFSTAYKGHVIRRIQYVSYTQVDVFVFDLRTETLVNLLSAPRDFTIPACKELIDQHIESGQEGKLKLVTVPTKVKVEFEVTVDLFLTEHGLPSHVESRGIAEIEGSKIDRDDRLLPYAVAEAVARDEVITAARANYTSQEGYLRARQPK